MKLPNAIFSVTPVVLCGGSGTRLWPLSRAAFPKQFLALSGKTTLFQQAIERLQALKNKDIQLNNTLIVTNEEHRFLVLDQLREIKNIESQILLEPLSLNTAPALTFAAIQANSMQQDPILIIIPSDHKIKNNIMFINSLKKSIKVAYEGPVVILGIKPNRADTGFGYIKHQGQEGENGELDVIAFEEKPDFDTAQKYLDSNDFYWNSGIFVMKASVWINILGQCRPDILNATNKSLEQCTKDGKFIRPNIDLFKKIPSESIDYAVMEKLPGLYPIKMISLDAGWDDLGSWDAVWKSSKKDTQGNVTFGDNIINDTKDCLIYSSNRLVATSGLENVAIIETADSVLVLDRSQTQDVKAIVNQLISQKREEQNLHRKVYRPWGWFDTLEQSDRFKVKHIQVNPGANLSLQKHKKRSEHWVVVKGVAKVICENKVFTLKENESTYIPLGSKHQLFNPGKDILEIIEIQSGSYLGEDDIERYKDSYGRVK